MREVTILVENLTGCDLELSRVVSQDGTPRNPPPEVLSRACKLSWLGRTKEGQRTGCAMAIEFRSKGSGYADTRPSRKSFMLAVQLPRPSQGVVSWLGALSSPGGDVPKFAARLQDLAPGQSPGDVRQLLEQAPPLQSHGSAAGCEWLVVRREAEFVDVRLRLLPEDTAVPEQRSEELPPELTQKDEFGLSPKTLLALRLAPRMPANSLSLDVPADLIKDPRSWTVEDISVWLHWLGIGEHVEAFASRNVDGRLLLQLGADSAWAELGVTDPAQQRVLDSAVEPLRCFHQGSGLESGLALHAIEGPVAGRVFLVGSGGVTGGRHCASNGIVLSENYVSRRHFLILRDRSGQYLLQDVGSTTGTFLMVREELPLDHQMIIQLGTTELTVYIEGDCCTLLATEGPDKDISAMVPPQGLAIGREAGNGLCIRDPQISAFHCKVRPVPDHGFILDDEYSTNRTWLRLAADGQPSRRYLLRIGDLFKVGSTLFHVVEPPPMEDVPGEALPSALDRLDHTRFPTSPSSAEEPELSDDAEVAVPAAMPTESQLRWEPMLEGDARQSLSPEEYARRLTSSRRRVAEGSARRSAGTANDLQGSQDARVFDMQERELSSLQQRMRNSRAQTAYTLQQQRQGEEGKRDEQRDEDLCKICYDAVIDVVLYPCGHYMLCRWCAQMVSDCPVCRYVITDVIRTYKA
ncbi:Rnf34 [Symbiodinium sp. CCMP2456]|nr:Rnf34 [Symbiodinium sp. CCMP2456]